MSLAQSLIEVAVILLAMIVSVGALLMLGVWILWAIFGSPDDL